MRNDIHSPANINPADYEYVGSFDLYPGPGSFVSSTTRDEETPFGLVEAALNYEHAMYLGGTRLLRDKGVHVHGEDNPGQCDHCGVRIRYVAIHLHRPSGKYLGVGQTCAERTFTCDSRRTLDIRRLQEAAANERERAKAFGKANEWVQQHCPELSGWLLSPRASEVHHIFAEMAQKLVRWGSLSEKQLAFARKLLVEHFEKQRNGGKTDRQLQIEAERAAAEDCPEGRQVITGVVLKADYYGDEYSPWGQQYKMTVKDERGFCVFVTVPSSLEVNKGDRLTLTATLQRSQKDIKFGYGKRPSKCRKLETAGAQP